MDTYRKTTSEQLSSNTATPGVMLLMLTAVLLFQSAQTDKRLGGWILRGRRRLIALSTHAFWPGKQVNCAWATTALPAIIIIIATRAAATARGRSCCVTPIVLLFAIFSFSLPCLALPFPVRVYLFTRRFAALFPSDDDDRHA